MVIIPEMKLLFDSLLDELLFHFVKAGWNVHSAKTLYFHKYQWPDIVLSEKVSKHRGEERDIETLGCYEPYHGNWLYEGQVVLYVNAIEKVAEAYCKDPSNNTIEKNEALQNLIRIILIHEFVHWIMHWIESPQLSSNYFLSRKFIPFKYETQDEQDFHEGFAQLITCLFCAGDKNLKNMFDWLGKAQCPVYNKYKELMPKIDTIEKAICLLTFLREVGVQEFEMTKELAWDFTDLSKSKWDDRQTKKSFQDIVDVARKGSISPTNFDLINGIKKGVIIGKKFGI